MGGGSKNSKLKQLSREYEIKDPQQQITMVSEVLLDAFILVSCFGWCGRGTLRMVHPGSFPWAPKAEQKLLLFGFLCRWHKVLVICVMIQVYPGRTGQGVYPAWQSGKRLWYALTHKSFKGMKSHRSLGEGNMGRRRQGSLNNPERKMPMPQGSSGELRYLKTIGYLGETLNAYKSASREVRISLRKPWDLIMDWHQRIGYVLMCWTVLCQSTNPRMLASFQMSSLWVKIGHTEKQKKPGLLKQITYLH